MSEEQIEQATESPLLPQMKYLRRDLRRWRYAAADEARDLRGVVADLRNTTEYILDKPDAASRLFLPLIAIAILLGILTMLAGVLVWGMR